MLFYLQHFLLLWQSLHQPVSVQDWAESFNPLKRYHILFTCFNTLCNCTDTRQKLVLFKSYLSLAILGSIITTALVYAKLLEFIDFLYFLSLVKIGVTLLKYLPQLVLNYTTKSTVGWSIENIILDLGGGMLSIVQMIIDAFILNSWTPFIGNPVKFGLGLSSIIFDGLFIIQHYFLSYDNDEEQVDLERAPLLPMASSTESLHSSFVWKYTSSILLKTL